MKKTKPIRELFCLSLKKPLQIMRITIFLMILGIMEVHAIDAYSQKTKLSLNYTETELAKVLDDIEVESEFFFVYNEKLLDTDRKVSINSDGRLISEILDDLFSNSDVKYTIIDRKIILSPKSLKNPFELQQRSIAGVVRDENGNPMPGVNIQVEGTAIGVMTDIDGKYSISIPNENAVLIFSFIGYVSQKVPVTGRTAFDISLEPAMESLEEVVVIGYGTQKKQSIVGAITQTTNEDLQRSGGVTNVAQALTGQLPGIITIQSNGEPGGYGRQQNTTTIFIRGQNTWNGGQPLVLVDGVERPMDKMDISEVENISVLKDASATAVFGVRGANGVILITTKRGSVGKPKLSFSYNTTALTVSKLPQIKESYSAILHRDESIEREVALNELSWEDYKPYEMAVRYMLPQTPEYALIYANVNWEEATWKDWGISHRANVNVRGGTNFVSYFGSLAYLHEGDMLKQYDNHKGYQPNYNYDRLNFRSNFDFKLTKTTNLAVNISGAFGVKNANNGDDQQNRLWSSTYSMAPDLFLPQYPDGRWGWSGITMKENPLGALYNQGIKTNYLTELNSDFAFEQKLDFIIKGLSAKASLFYDNTIVSESQLSDSNHTRPDQSGSNTPEKIIYPELYTGPDQDPLVYTHDLPTAPGESGVAAMYGWFMRPWSIVQESLVAGETERRLLYQFQLNYGQKFGLHNVGAMGVVKRQEYARGSMFKNYREDWVFRGTYDYDSRYLFEVNGAYNGSEQFGPGYRFAFFPSLALGWNIANEKFFKIDWINRLKLRYSVGKVGDDQVSGGRWLYDTQYSYGGQSRIGELTTANSPYYNYKLSVVGNPDIHWEKATKNNYGIEAGLFNNLISFTAEIFNENRTDILLAGGSRAVPNYFGATPPPANVGRVKSNGWEIETRIDKRSISGISYWAVVSITHTENKILFKDDPILYFDYQKQEGYTVGQTRSQMIAGYNNNWDDIYASTAFETNDLHKIPGNFNIIDFNNDGLIKSDDAVPTGFSSVPQNTFNYSLGASFKGFSAMVQIYAVNNVSRNFTLNDFDGWTNVVFEQPGKSGYWSRDNMNPDAAYVKPWKTSGLKAGEYWILDGSYVRLKTAEVAYTFEEKLLKKVGISNLRIYLNGNNLLFWSKMPDDREGTFVGADNASGAYPTTKRINLGVDVTF
jgi:TonB-linked SusC/RagA family outer membrane protein